MINSNKIVEIKSRNKEAKEKALKALEAIEDIYNIPCELVSYEELLELYKTLPISLTSTLTEWIASENTTINKATFGKLNGHYNMRHSNATKRKIGEHTKKLWASNGIAKQKMVEGLRNSGKCQKGKIKNPREEKICKRCGKVFETLVTSTQEYCNSTCSGHIAIQNASKVYLEMRAENRRKIKEYVIQWSKENSYIVENTPLNKIKTTLQPLIDDISKYFGVKDMRVISMAVFGEDRGRKELIKFMKNVCNEKIC